ncbi:MAG TPA: cobalt ECF transporter T component CbiQ [Anaerolineales bacterium]|nr:cobalt ECF transporter T component CbiQ [Anaerolineales bacterium]
MHSDVFDRYHHGHSLIHDLDPRIKVVVAIAFIISNALLPDGAWTAFALAWSLVLIANVLSGLGISFTFRRSFIALPFALAAITVLFSIPGEPLVTVRLLMMNLTITDAGFLRFVSIVIRSWLSVQMAILLVATTEFPKIVHALNHLRVPTILTVIISFLYRYLFVLTDEVLRMLRARQARSAAVSGINAGGNMLWRARIAGHMAGQLFLRSYERSDRIYNAMLSRGYKGELMTIHPHHFHNSDLWIGAFAILVLILIQVAGRLS